MNHIEYINNLKSSMKAYFNIFENQRYKESKLEYNIENQNIYVILPKNYVSIDFSNLNSFINHFNHL